MKRLLLIVVIILITGHAYADSCEIVEFQTYNNVTGGGNRDRVSINTEFCVAFVIRNAGSVNHFDPKVSVRFLGGSTSTIDVKTGWVEVGTTRTGQFCFDSGVPVYSLSCSW